MFRKTVSHLPKPKLSFNRFNQIFFTFKEIVKIAFKIKPWLLLSIILINSIFGFSTVLNFYIQKLILDKLISGIGSPNVYAIITPIILLVGLALLISLLRNVFGSLSDFFARNLARYFDVELDLLIGGKMSHLDMETLEDPEFRDRFNKIERESARRAWQLMIPLSSIPNYLFNFISSVAILALIHPAISLLVLLISLPRFVINQKYIKKRYELDTALSPQNRIWGWLSSYLVRNRNYMELKILGIADFLLAKMKGVAMPIIDKAVDLRREQEKRRVLTIIPISILEYAISILLIYWTLIRRITVGSFQMYLQALRSAQDSLANLVGATLELYENYIYVSDLVWLLNLETELESGKSGKKIPSRSGIKFDNVWFKYKTSKRWVAKDVNFEIKPGENIAIVGENGAGKTTLIKLLAGFYKVNKGAVTIGRVNVDDISLKVWRNKLSVLFQQFESYPFSAKETIGFGDISRIGNLSEIVDTAKKVGIDKFLRSLPLAYDNPLVPEFEKGVHPSTGQWQRLGIARTLFRKGAEVVILDEPTSNIDPEGEEKIFKELNQLLKQKILIFVTQRFSTVRIADRIFVMDKGQIIEQGSHQELIEKKGKYAKLFNLQAKAYNL